MKKILLTVAIALTANFTFAQRSIDWSVEEVSSPTQVVHNVQTVVKYVCKNNGPDIAEVGDSVYSRGVLNNQLVTGWVLTLLKADLAVGDTIHLTFNIAGIPVDGLSFNGPFAVQSLLQDRPDLILETQGTLTNNTSTKTIPYINEKGWGVSVSTISSNSTLSIYPNPTSSLLNIDVATIGAAQDAVLEIVDMTGKVVMTVNGYNTESGFNVNVEGLNKGIYLVRVQNGDFISTSKISIQ